MKTESLDVGNSLEDELLQLIARQASRVPFPVFVGAAIITQFASQYLPAALWGGWFAVAIFMLVVRWLVYRKLPELNHISQAKRLKIVILLNAAHGLVYGVSLAFFPHFSELERAVQTIVLIGMCVGAVSTTAGYRPIFYVFLVPVILPLSAMWALSPGHSANHMIEYLVALLAFMFGGLLVGMANDAFRLFRESFEIRLQQLGLNRKLQAALDKAESASRAKTRFLASASHDLRQPIHTLSLFGAALEMQPLNEKSREITQHMNAALKVLENQLDALLDISKLDANVVQVRSSSINTRALLKRLSFDYEKLAREKLLDYRFECDRDYPVESDEVLLERILRNLLSNAIKYTDNGCVELKVYERADEIVIEVTDTGCGIKPEEQSRVFEEFYQVSNPERDRSKGLGLGLAIVRRLIELLDIRLEFDSVPQRGTCFVLSLPKARSAALPEPKDDVENFEWQNLCVLVVDDEVAVGLGTRALLESLGCQVMVTNDTVSSLDAAKRMRPDVVLADFRLRGTETGIQVIEALRKSRPELPAILISGDTAPDRLREARAAGLDLLHKPVMMGALKQAVVEVCRM